MNVLRSGDFLQMVMEISLKNATEYGVITLASFVSFGF